MGAIVKFFPKIAYVGKFALKIMNFWTWFLAQKNLNSTQAEYFLDMSWAMKFFAGSHASPGCVPDSSNPAIDASTPEDLARVSQGMSWDTPWDTLHCRVSCDLGGVPTVKSACQSGSCESIRVLKNLRNNVLG